MAHIRSPGAQPQLPFLGAGAGAAAPPAGVPPPAGLAAPPAGLAAPPAGGLYVPFAATADALADAVGAASAVGVGGGVGSGVGVGVGATEGALSVAATGGGSPPPFIAMNAPTIAATATVAPMPMKSGVLFF